MAALTGFFPNHALRAGCAAVALLIIAGCDRSDPSTDAAAAAAEASAVAALVNGRPVYMSDVQLEAEAQGLIQAGKRLEIDSAEFNQVLDQLIDVKLMAMEAESRGLDEDPSSRHRLEAAREHILGNILVDAVVEERVDEAAIRKMYDAQIAIWELGDEAQVRHIVAASKDEIDKVVADLNAGADFTVLASRTSIDEATRMEGGDLGYMTEGEAAPEFAKAIRTTATGALSKPFETEMGWHVVKIDDRRKEQPPTLEELREPILKHLTMMQIGEVLKELRTKSRVEKQTTPQNSTLEVDPFTLDEPEPAAPKAPAAASFEAAGPRPSPPDTRTPPPQQPAQQPVTQPQAGVTAPAAAPSATPAEARTGDPVPDAQN